MSSWSSSSRIGKKFGDTDISVSRGKRLLVMARRSYGQQMKYFPYIVLCVIPPARMKRRKEIFFVCFE